MTYFDDARAAGEQKFRDEIDTIVQRLIGERDQARNERDTAIAELEAHVCPTPEPEPGKQWFLGMATEADQWTQRATAVGHPVNVRRRFIPRWSVSGLVALAEECHNVGCLPYISAKMAPHTWQQVASGALDADATNLGRQLGNLGYRIRVTFHHEPRPASVNELVDWGRALTRLFTRMRQGAGNNATNLILGPTDNGFPWGQNWTGRVTKADLDRYYTDTFLAACDVLGADFYDGATDRNQGEPAWIKMRNFANYFNARGFQGVNNPGWKYDVGEWNFVDPQDCDDTWAFLTSDAGKDFNCLAVFNSSHNNRTDLPAQLGGSWELRGERLAAFRQMLEAANVKVTA